MNLKVSREFSNVLCSRKAQYVTDYAPLGLTFPPNVQLLDFVPLPSGSYILRVHHIYAVNEDATLSQPVTIDVSNTAK